MKRVRQLREIVAAFVVVAALSPVAARAQSQPVQAQGGPDVDATRRLGPLYVRPTIALTNAGVDTNVFNESDPANPESDFTMTVTPAATIWLPFYSSWVRGTVQEELVWYKQFASERSANTGTGLTWTVPLSRFTVAVGGTWLRTSDRPGFEIDERARRWERAVTGTFELRALSRTFVGAYFERRTTDFDESESFRDTVLHEELNRSQVSEWVTVRHELTPLTNLTVEVGLQQDHFEFEPVRDADSTRIVAGLTFAPDALISGSAKFGYRQYSPDAPDIPDYSGSTAAVNIAYVARTTTKLGLEVNRDVEYSYDVNQPYYVLTGIVGNITQQIHGPLDVEGRASAERLAYRSRVDATVLVPNRIDHVRGYGGGIGYKANVDLRVAFNFDHVERDSEIATHQYSGWRYGVGMTYGF